MSNDIQKADQIAHRFYTKLSLVVSYARATAEPSAQSKVDKWFNLETPDADTFKKHTTIYRSISSSPSPPPSFQLQVLLSIPELTNNQVLAYVAPDSSRSPIDPSPKYILLENWSLVFTPHQTNLPSEDRSDVTPPTIYKHGISLFRSMFTLLRILPAWKLARRLRSQRNGKFSIELRVEGMGEDSSISAHDILGFGTPVHNHSALPMDFHEFSPVPHPKGSLALSVTCLSSPNFRLVDRESLLSSRFLSQDEGPEFTPTLLKNQQRESLSPSPGSLPLRTSLPRSPPSSIAERFVVPPPSHTRTPSLSGGSPRLQSVALPMTRAPSSASGAIPTASASGVSEGSSTRQGGASPGSREDSLPISGLAARLRRESLGRGSETPSSAGPVAIRRPQVHPFKSYTLSSGSPSLHSPSPSLRQHSPLSTGGAGPSLPSRPPHSPISSRAQGPPSPIGIGGKLPLPVTPFRPSPPLGPSSLGDRRSLASAEGVVASGTTGDASPRPSGKRYSSSFGHRYANSGGAGSEGSAGSGARDQERPSSASFLSTNTDDDEISAFVQDIDARKPLTSTRDQRSQESPSPAPSGEALSTDAGRSRIRTMSVPGPVLTTAEAVGERLKEMNEAFLASLAGFGNRRRQGSEDRQSSAGSSTARALSSGASTVGRRTILDPISIHGRQSRQDESGNASPSMSRRTSATGMYGLPSPYVRPRFASTGSARSGMSIASEEVLGRMDPEIEDERRRSRGSFPPEPR
ncbi:unnamed protein product [Somion occarium]|uniref:Autophagy-related protein 13 n=1 Tax=Somion occarium TaxID=3059160 RepID=A0ABP1DUF6_9APHY